MARTAHRRPPVPVLVLVLALLAGGGWWWWHSSHPAEAGAATAYSGQVEARQYQVASAIAGRVAKVDATEGAAVTAGQALVTLDTAALDLQLKAAQQGVLAAQAAVTNAKDTGTKADVTAAEARVEQANAAVGLAQVQLGYAAVTAPRAGQVVSVATNVGQNAAPGRTLVSMVDPADLFVRIFVPENKIGTVAVGQAVTARTDAGATVDGTVSFVAAQAEFTPNTVQTAEQRAKLVYEVRVTLTHPSGSSTTLTSGMPVDVTFR